MSEMHEWPVRLERLAALDALLGTGSVTAAARRLGLSQPAMSRLLGRLREELQDPLLVRAGRGLVPTPRALALAPALHAALEAVRQAVAPPEAFSPATSRRTWRLATADYATAVLVAPLLERLAKEAPGMQVSTVPLTASAAVELVQGEVDAVLCPPRDLGAGLVWSRLLRDDWVAVLRGGHPSGGARQLTLEALCTTPQVFVAPSGQASGVLDVALARLGRRRQVALTVPSFLLAPVVVARTGLLGVVPRRVAAALAGPLGLEVLELPLPLPGLAVASGWHERSRRDPAHQWFRRQLVAVAAGHPGTGPAAGPRGTGRPGAASHRP